MTTARRNVMLGTAGHVDHGKTALVKLLTGCETDTMAEEKQRAAAVAQISNLLYRRFPTGRTSPPPNHRRTDGRFAECNSALRQIENLRYGQTSPATPPPS